jgi:two-component sensor histidine kinase
MEISARKHVEEQLRHSLNEKEVLLRELYHRTKNNMQVIASLLSLKQGVLPDTETTEVLKDLEAKIYTMSLVHQMLYQSKNLNRIDLGEYCRELCTLTMEAFYESARKVSIIYDISPVEVGLDAAIPLGLVVNELLTNALKYAFRGRECGVIRIGLRAPGTLIISDDGTGMPPEASRGSESSLGLTTVRELIEGQLGGTITLGDTPGGGCSWTITFPGEEAAASV